jgi:hypothetical protein
MLMSRMPIAVIMQRRAVQHRWADESWAAVGAVSDIGGRIAADTTIRAQDAEYYLVRGLQLELYPDENDGYFENWVAPEPKIFVMWRMQEQRALPVAASVSYGEGTRMLDSGECADGVPMPADVHAWLGQYLHAHYEPPKRGRRHG